ncbi:MAG: SPFH domain-containing protein [Coriobacteriales bacterium]|jgi:membrane protease subunit (stomatin/prohibitin family)|nr:SPFH domain-containing protein [Coriobacteriales bacterium]
MGFIQAFQGAIGGTFADQWKDFYTVPNGVSHTAGVVPAVPNGTNAGRGSNLKYSANIISNGSLLVVPEGFSLITVENGAITGFVAQPGGYKWASDDPNSQSIFAGNGIIAPTVTQSVERFKFGGQPGAQQLAFFINLKEIPDNKFGTQSTVYWDDAYLRTQAGAITRGSYSLRIVDPILFVKQFVPVEFLSANAPAFDFADIHNKAAAQLFNEVVASLSAAFSSYTNDPNKGKRITQLQGDAVGFAQSLGDAVEKAYFWKANRGLEIIAAALVAIEYDEGTRKMLAEVQEGDAMAGSRANVVTQLSLARGIEAAGSNTGGNGGALGMAFMGMGMNAGGATLQQYQQQGGPDNPLFPAAAQAAPSAQAVPPVQGAAAVPAASGAAPSAEDPYEKLTKLKGLLDASVITQEDFDAAKAKILGL